MIHTPLNLKVFSIFESVLRGKHGGYESYPPKLKGKNFQNQSFSDTLQVIMFFERHFDLQSNVKCRQSYNNIIVNVITEGKSRYQPNTTSEWEYTKDS